MKKTLLLLFVLTIGFSNAQNIFKENFSTYTTDTQLSGQGVWTNNSSNAGGLGGCAGFACQNAKVIANPISYPFYGVQTNNSFELKPDVDGCGRSFIPVATGEFHVGMVLNLTSAPATTTNDFFRVMSGGNFNSVFKIYAKSSGSGYVIGISKGASATISFTNTVLSYNQNSLLTIKYFILPGTSDDVLQLQLNYNFTTTILVPPDVSINSGTDQTGSIDRMTFRQNTATGIPTGRVGLVSASTTLNGLLFEPLSTSEFSQNSFKINSFKAGNGILTINSEVNLNKATLTIYTILGTIIESKKIALKQNTNDIAINALTNTTAYIIEIVTENGSRFAQKIVVN